MSIGSFNNEEYERLVKSQRTGKYGHLQSWKELFMFQVKFASVQQCKEIGVWAEKANRGERVLLPLMKNV